MPNKPQLEQFADPCHYLLWFCSCCSSFSFSYWCCGCSCSYHFLFLLLSCFPFFSSLLLFLLVFLLLIFLLLSWWLLLLLLLAFPRRQKPSKEPFAPNHAQTTSISCISSATSLSRRSQPTWLDLRTKAHTRWWRRKRKFSQEVGRSSANMPKTPRTKGKGRPKSYGPAWGLPFDPQNSIKTEKCAKSDAQLSESRSRDTRTRCRERVAVQRGFLWKGLLMERRVGSWEELTFGS